MSDLDKQAIVCPSCSRSYKWQANFEGKELSCQCGHVFMVEAAACDNANELKNSSQQNAHRSFGLYAEACGRTSAVQRALENRVDDITPSVVKDWYVPLVCIPLGWVVTFGLSIYVLGEAKVGSYAAIGAILTQLVIFIPTALWSLLFVTKWFDLAFSDFKTTILKLAAITFLPAAICDVLLIQIMSIAGFDPWYLAACLAPYIFLCGVPTALMFGMQLYEAAIFLVLMFVPRGASYFGLAVLFPEYFDATF